MHALFFLKHSRAADQELQFALRGIARNCPFIEKVWVFGDRPHFLSEDTRLIEHVPHQYVAGVGNFKTPVTNFFLLFWLSSLIPELSPEFLWFCDDFIVLEPLSYEDAKKDRYLQDLAVSKSRGRGLWKDSLWRTYDLLKRLGYTGYNFETHTPTYYTKRRVLEAYRDFQDFVTEDRWQGMLGPTAILNHVYARENFPLTKLADEGRHVGFHHQAASYEQIVAACRAKTFLNFDDDAFDGNMRRFLQEQFPEPCKFERPPNNSTHSLARRASKDSLALRASKDEETVLFAMELGGGWGHIGVMQPLAKRLSETGRRVVVATPQASLAAKWLKDIPATIVSGPTTGPCGQDRAVHTFADVLGATAFQSAEQLAANAEAWSLLLDRYQPATIVCDHAPTALLASRLTSARRIVPGQGFTIPDQISPLPDWRPKLSARPEVLLQEEHRVLDVMNEWLASRGGKLLSRVADLYHEVDGQILATLPELDSYAPRVAPAAYFSVWPSSGGLEPHWPPQPGKRILAYLKPFAALPVLLEQLRRLTASSLVVCPGIDPKLTAACDGQRVRIEQEPVDLTAALEQCDLAIGNGTHGFTAMALLAGKPQLMIPLVLEQRLTSLQVVKLGAGVIGQQRDGKDVVLKLRKLWESPELRESAAGFAESQRSLLNGIDDAVALICRSTCELATRQPAIL